jgi:hypothetical protein
MLSFKKLDHNKINQKVRHQISIEIIMKIVRIDHNAKQGEEELEEEEIDPNKIDNKIIKKKIQEIIIKNQMKILYMWVTLVGKQQN